MSVYAIYKCDGCNAVSDEVLLGSEFISVSGRSYGIGRRHYAKPRKAAPTGWTAYDAIGCCYCPKCTKELEDES